MAHTLYGHWWYVRWCGSFKTWMKALNGYIHPFIKFQRQCGWPLNIHQSRLEPFRNPNRGVFFEHQEFNNNFLSSPQKNTYYSHSSRELETEIHELSTWYCLQKPHLLPKRCNSLWNINALPLCCICVKNISQRCSTLLFCFDLTRLID